MMKDRTDTMIEDEVDAIRQKIRARIKEMTSEQRQAYYQELADQIHEEFGVITNPLKPVKLSKTRNEL